MPKIGLKPKKKMDLQLKGLIYFGNMAKVKITENAYPLHKADKYRANIRIGFDYKTENYSTKKTLPVLSLYSADEEEINLLIESLESAIITLSNAKERLKNLND